MKELIIEQNTGLKINGWKCIAKYEHHNLWERDCDSQANTIKESFPKKTIPKRSKYLFGLMLLKKERKRKNGKIGADYLLRLLDDEN